MKIKSILKIELIFIALFVFSCGDDENEYSFKNQDLSGKIGGDSWTYEDGFIDEFTFEGKDFLSSNLTLTQDGSVCEVDLEGNYIYFGAPKKVGVYKLKGGNERIFLVMNNNHTASFDANKGAIEILSITETQVTGRIDARFNGNNFVNGNFTVSFCPDPGS